MGVLPPVNKQHWLLMVDLNIKYVYVCCFLPLASGGFKPDKWLV